MRVVRANQRQRREATSLASSIGGAQFRQLVDDSQAVWVVLDEDGEVAGAAGASVRGERVDLTIAFVAPHARGHSLQQRLIRARLRWGRSEGAKVAYTYAARRNRASLISLLRCGFVPWQMQDGFVYVAQWLT